MIGKTISHYKILEKLGEGGMGEVYLAEDTKLKRKVALKFLPKEFSRDPKAKERFITEARSSSKLDHNNICIIYDINETDDGQLFISMNYCKGDTLQDYIKEKDSTLKEILKYITQIAKGLDKAHSKGIVHCDIKPTNIIITDDGVAKIVDFGIAKIASEEKLISKDRTSGTIAYMSPEQVSNATIDARTDIWSLGIVCYEMLTKQQPFKDSYNEALMYSIINEDPEPLRLINHDVPPELEKIVLKMLCKNPEDRYGSIVEFIKDLGKYKKSSKLNPFEFKQLYKYLKKPKIALPSTIIFILLILIAGRIIYHTTKINWARTQAIPEIERLYEEGDRKGAFEVALQAEKYISKDSTLIKIWPGISNYINIHSDPSGAKVYRSNTYSDTIWQYLGKTPIDSLRVLRAYSRWKIEKGGFNNIYRLAHQREIHNEIFILDKNGSIPSGMIRISGGSFPLSMPGLDHLNVDTLSDFLIDKYEVTNKEYKIFIDNDGYKKKEYWKRPFVKNGQTLPWEEAISKFTDKTGRPGPANWEAGIYPDGEEDYPVSGVSWYEALAFAEFVGKKLPTIFHWSRAAGSDYKTPYIVPLSNFSDQGLADVGSYQGMNPYGAYDMAGNVREWCWNSSNQNAHYILGGGWNDLTYMFNDAYTQSSFDRSKTNGFRCIKYLEMEENLAELFRTIELPFRDFMNEKPVSNEIFNIYMNQYAYDKSELNSIIESTDSTSEFWIKEKITFDAAYGNEKMIAYLFLPKNSNPPYHTVVYFPGSNAIHDRASSLIRIRSFDFIIKTGRAVLFPIYKSTYERGDDLNSDYPNETNFFKEHVIMWAKDLQRSIDYLESRSDINTNALAYFGVSWGAAMGPIIMAVEERLKTGVLYIAGLAFQKSQPEVDPIHFLPRIKIPVLMLSGKYDHFFPYQTSQIPMFELMGTKTEHKKHIVHETGHFVPRIQLIKETLNWLDIYLGPVE